MSNIFKLLIIFSLLITNTHAAKKIKIYLKYIHQFQFAGYYMAKEKGYYQDVGLDVELVPTSGSQLELYRALLSGDAGFGIADDSIIKEYLNGKDLVIVSQIFQRSPQILVTRKGSGLNTLDKLQGKRITQDPFNISINEMLRINNIDYNLVGKNLNYSDGVDFFKAGNTDAIMAYETSLKGLEKRLGFELNVFSPKDYNVHSYGDLLYTTEKYLSKNYEAVHNFKKASEKGWKYALMHKKETIDVIKNKYHSQRSLEDLEFEAIQVSKLIASDLVELGTLKQEKLETIKENYKKSMTFLRDDISPLLLKNHKERKLIIPWWIYLGIMLLITIFFTNRRYLTKEIKEKTIQIKKVANESVKTSKELIYTMSEVAEKRSNETGNHVKRVSQFTRIIAKAYGIKGDELDMLTDASTMHDIGKVSVPDHVLKKPGRLTKEEFDIMKEHSMAGYEIFKNSNKKMFKACAVIAKEHHEKWNGSGYPDGLKGENIHIYARIVGLVDVYDALSCERVYKPAWEESKIIKLIKEEKGSHFDPHVVDIFFEVYDKIRQVKNELKG